MPFLTAQSHRLALFRANHLSATKRRQFPGATKSPRPTTFPDVSISPKSPKPFLYATAEVGLILLIGLGSIDWFRPMNVSR